MARQNKIAEKLQMSQAQISRILSGKSGVGDSAAKKFQELTGIKWIEFKIMPPAEIEKHLSSAIDC